MEFVFLCGDEMVTLTGRAGLVLLFDAQVLHFALRLSRNQYLPVFGSANRKIHVCQSSS
jgi:hypothetical protein